MAECWRNGMDTLYVSRHFRSLPEKEKPLIWYDEFHTEELNWYEVRDFDPKFNPHFLPVKKDD